MTKSTLHLTIETNLIEQAKLSDLNLSAEFEEWIKIRLGNINEDKPLINTDLEIAKHMAEIQKLKNQAEIQEEQKSQEQEEVMVIDGIIDNELSTTKKDHPETTWDTIIEDRIHGVQFLFQKKFHKQLNPLESKEFLENRLKERGLYG
jgi:post-segregation antitoxin (ccd killing protein)